MKNFLAPIAKAINAFIQLDPESNERLHKLSGKVVAIELLPLKFKFYCLFHDNTIELQKTGTYTPDTSITGTPLQLLGVVLHKTNRQHFFADDVKMTGDAEIGQLVMALFDELEIDWEEQASHFIGDVPTQHVSKFLRGVSRWLKDTEKSFTENVIDYIHEEKEWLPARAALNDLFSDIDTLRMDVDRIEARLSALKKIQNEA